MENREMTGPQVVRDAEDVRNEGVVGVEMSRGYRGQGPQKEIGLEV